MNKIQKTSYLWAYFLLTDEVKKYAQCDHPTVNLTVQVKYNPGTSTMPSTANISIVAKDDPDNPQPQTSALTVAHQPCKASVRPEKTIRQTTVKLFTIDFQPFSIVEDEGFVGFVTALNPAYCLPNRKVITNTMIPAEYELCVTAVREMLSSLRSVCLTTDTCDSTFHNRHI
ncbi:hypothetical protein PR048_015613 [Dryococelus australis]|uniref:Uncharacterized protein n=1 Tax=Dryococelus australis TaxID=614101 RepID=A0ABQ9HHI1_9NEOP|nr:hypothetical protein PR048_015613 [Dryococelus australis]